MSRNMVVVINSWIFCQNLESFANLSLEHLSGCVNDFEYICMYINNQTVRVNMQMVNVCICLCMNRKQTNSLVCCPFILFLINILHIQILVHINTVSVFVVDTAARFQNSKKWCHILSKMKSIALYGTEYTSKNWQVNHMRLAFGNVSRLTHIFSSVYIFLTINQH